jgi:hypothetical protein
VSEPNSEPEKPKLKIDFAPNAVCGSFACGGCYDVGDGKQIHPPRSGYEQEQLIALDKENE